ncbi:baseplate J/gp47 family protein [uncultured Megasphaera sp.]|uniref:baseplate J/gp47 family protein n=1 Tax=uncultured Megasphaera sp. TaxID=165188 RepID=UPI00265A74A7|nr:baseplate J/gp47 family protein [uncultured Megasphaera sp.]
MYEAREQEAILQDLQENTGGDAAKFEGTFEYDVLASNAIEFSKQEVEREQMYKAGFAATSFGEYLTMRAEEHGVIRKIAVKALGTVTVTGTGIIPAGSIFSTVSGITFHTLKEAAVVQSGKIDVEADTAGVNGNVAAGLITVIPMSIPGITAVTNEQATYDGFDEESDEELYNRLIFKVRMPATSGNENNYIEWGTSIQGVGRIAVKKLWNGNGTVKVIVTDANGQPASEHLLEEVRTYIETQHPIGATVTVVAPEVLALSVALTPTKGAGDSTAIQKAINDFFTSTEFDGTKISYAKIGEVILTNSAATRVEDYDNLTINGAKDNIAVTNEQIPSVTEVTLHGG